VASWAALMVHAGTVSASQGAIRTRPIEDLQVTRGIVLAVFS
jgi:hypothetical protein